MSVLKLVAYYSVYFAIGAFLVANFILTNDQTERIFHSIVPDPKVLEIEEWCPNLA